MPFSCTTNSTDFNPTSLPSLEGKVYIVTGGNAGIGRFTVLHLASHGARVYMGSRDSSKALSAITELQAELAARGASADIRALRMDMMDLSSIVAAAREFLAQESRLDGLVNSAGIMAVPFQLSKDGFESQFQTNYLGHWLLTHHLLPVMSKTSANSPAPARLANVSSFMHSTSAPSGGIDFDDISLSESGPWTRYGQSKLANVLHAKELHNRYGPNTPSPTAGEFILAASLHPGAVDTGLHNNASTYNAVHGVMRRIGVYITPDQGSWTSLFVAASNEFTAEMAGKYFVPFGKEKEPSRHAGKKELARQLWEWTEGQMKEKGFI